MVFGSGLITLCCVISSVMYSSTTEGCCRVVSKFLRAGFSEKRVVLKPNRNPWVIPVMKNSVRAASGWSERYSFHFSWLSGVVMLAASGGQGKQLMCWRYGTTNLAASPSRVTASWLKELVRLWCKSDIIVQQSC